jgi:D-alanyl-D-alanine carboxypeptidase
MSSPVFRSMVRRRYYWLPAGPGHRKYLWLNDNPLLGSYPGATGIKTGWTPYAGRCLLFAATRGGRSFIGVTLDSGGSGPARSRAAAVKMLNWAFAASRQHHPAVPPPPAQGRAGAGGSSPGPGPVSTAPTSPTTPLVGAENTVLAPDLQRPGAVQE